MLGIPGSEGCGCTAGDERAALNSDSEGSKVGKGLGAGRMVVVMLIMLIGRVEDACDAKKRGLPRCMGKERAD
jgi:hypothetical protein